MTSYTADLRALRVGESITEPEIAAGELYRAYKNANRLAPMRFTWNSKTHDEHGNPLAVVTRIR
jgi:hypothetical protein